MKADKSYERILHLEGKILRLEREQLDLRTEIIRSKAQLRVIWDELNANDFDNTVNDLRNKISDKLMNL